MRSISSVIAGVFSQPVNNMSRLRSRGVNLFVRYETEGLTATGQPNRSMSDWDAGVKANHALMIRQPSADLKADIAIPNLLGWLHEQDEIENAIISAQDNKTDVEAVYKGYEAEYARLKAASPDVPVWGTFDLNNEQWNRVDLKRIYSCVDGVIGDYYYIERGGGIADLRARIAAMRQLSGNRQLAVCVQTAYMNEGKTFFPGDRQPTPTEVGSLLAELTSTGIKPILFPQSFNPFKWMDGTPDDVWTAIQSWAEKLTPLPDVSGADTETRLEKLEARMTAISDAAGK